MNSKPRWRRRLRRAPTTAARLSPCLPLSRRRRRHAGGAAPGHRQRGRPGCGAGAATRPERRQRAGGSALVRARRAQRPVALGHYTVRPRRRAAGPRRPGGSGPAAAGAARGTMRWMPWPARRKAGGDDWWATAAHADASHRCALATHGADALTRTRPHCPPRPPAAAFTVYYGNLHSQTNNHSDGGGVVSSHTARRTRSPGATGRCLYLCGPALGRAWTCWSGSTTMFDGSDSTNAAASPTTAHNLYQSGLAAASNFNAAHPGFLAVVRHGMGRDQQRRTSASSTPTNCSRWGITAARTSSSATCSRPRATTPRCIRR